MKPIDAGQCDTHVLVCTNEKPEGKMCCKRVGGQEFFMKMKTKVRESGVSSSIWVTRTGCLGFCNAVGTTVVIHRPGQSPIWHNEVVDEDFDLLWKEIVGE